MILFIFEAYVGSFLKIDIDGNGVFLFPIISKKGSGKIFDRKDPKFPIFDRTGKFNSENRKSKILNMFLFFVLSELDPSLSERTFQKVYDSKIQKEKCSFISEKSILCRREQLRLRSSL
jgi:hypothetical protein